MKKIFFLLFIILFSLSFAQKKKPENTTPEKITAQQALQSNDTKVIASFMKNNPDDPNIPELRTKLLKIINQDNDPIAKPKVTPLTSENLEKQIKKNTNSGNSGKNAQATNVLNHLFDNNPNKKEAYVQIINKSKCNLIVKFDGKKFYNLDVAANNKNYILIDKGNYTLTTNICDAKYTSSKNINGDIVLTLKKK